MKIQFMKDAAKLVEIQELLVLSMLFNNNRAHTHKSRTHTQELLQPLNYSQSLSFSKIENNRFSMKIWLHIRYYQSVEPKSKKRIYNQAKKRQNSIKNVSVIEKKTLRHSWLSNEYNGNSQYYPNRDSEHQDIHAATVAVTFIFYSDFFAFFWFVRAISSYFLRFFLNHNYNL